MKTTTDKKHLQSKYTFIKYLNGDVEIESSDTYYDKPLVVRNTIHITTEESRIKLAKVLLMSDVEFEKEVMKSNHPSIPTIPSDKLKTLRKNIIKEEIE